MKGFLVAGGSVPGTDHTKPGQPGWTNNHDAHHFFVGDDSLVAVVSDGCGSTPHPEVGAFLGTHLLARLLTEEVRFVRGNPVYDIATAIRRQACALEWKLEEIAKLTGGSKGVQQVTYNALLFTLVGVLMTPEKTAVFSLGDGLFALNGEVTEIPPAEGNAPPYVGHRLLPGYMPEKYLEFTVHAVLPTKDVESILIGTDGVKDLREAEYDMLPGTEELVGPLSQFWEDPLYVNNPDAIRRRLAKANKETIEYSTDSEGRLQQTPRIKKGLLRDDTTMLVIRKEGA